MRHAGPLPLLAFIDNSTPDEMQKEDLADLSANRRHNIREIMVGEAGQHVVLAKLLAMGVPAQLAMPGLAYDLLADVGSAGMSRIQVKTSATISNGKHRFSLKRGFFRSKHGMFDYTADDFDIAAFVCLPAFQVFFKAWPTSRFSAGPNIFGYPELARESLHSAIVQRHNFSPRLLGTHSRSPRCQGAGCGDVP